MPTTKPQDNAPAIVNNSYTFIINNTYLMPVNINLSRENSGANPSSVSPKAEALPRKTKEEHEHIEFNLPNSVPAHQPDVQTPELATSISSYLTLIVPPGPMFKPTPQIIPNLAPIFSLKELNLLEEKSRTVKQQHSPGQIPPSPMLQSIPQAFPDLPSITSAEELRLREALIEPKSTTTKPPHRPRNAAQKCPVATQDGTVLGTVFEDSDKIERVMKQDVVNECADPQLKTATANHVGEKLKPIAKTAAERPLFKTTTTKDKPVKQLPLEPELNRDQLLFNVYIRGSGVVIYESIKRAYNFLKDNDRKNFYPYAQLFKNHMKGYDIFEDRFSIISNLVQDQYDNERETTDCCLPFFAKKSNKVADYHNTTLTAKFIRLFLNIDALLTAADIALTFEKDISALIEIKGANLSACTAKR